MPRHMRAAILYEQKKDLVIDDVTLPRTLDYGQVLVKVFYSGICGSQIGEIDGVKGEDKYLPHLLGHEGSGKVIGVGAGVTSLKPGNLVVLHWIKGMGIDSAPPLYRWREKPLNAGWVTTFNEYAIVSENRATVMPSDFDLKLATPFRLCHNYRIRRHQQRRPTQNRPVRRCLWHWGCGSQRHSGRENGFRPPCDCNRHRGFQA